MDEKQPAEQDPRPTPGDPADDHPAQEAHGGSMAPTLVNDTGEQLTDTPPEAPGR
ncbi:hypothetical protein [Pseudosporangium ferrugineum]|uniref:Uncharacterized protein n=1 Tax=Pseudosporangium ferrugineum TaxID=439699 RepID=A0A2T0RRP3_9ACTN|nr:hypothetical protein [Pseudosporangium ferrugineum]PRY23875.1 hypothetical protein CLV70_1145 [Pseudosporangium ferrugineum]